MGKILISAKNSRDLKKEFESYTYSPPAIKNERRKKYGELEVIKMENLLLKKMVREILDLK